ncbi:ABC transporter permease [Bacillus sp. 1P06AnD]|uniref:ABC transporter permease n=1 Tax=Bacillus sp. 1P06AnD TaxID=3132208 RepID=UPI00399FF860
MYIFTNAVRNLGRNKGRNGLMAIIIFAIIFTTVVSITINTTTSSIIDEYKKRFGSEVTFTYDNEKLQSVPMEEFKQPTTRQQIEFGESKLLQKKVIKMNIMFTTKLRALDEDQSPRMGGGATSDTVIGSGGQEQSPMLPAKGLIIGSSQSNISDDFKNGSRKIVKGKIYKKKNEVIVSEQFAELNKLSVGDSIKVSSLLKNKPNTEELKITGIYMDNTIPDPALAQMKMPSANRGNEILTSLETTEKMELGKDMSFVDAKYYLKDPSMLSAFTKELHQKGLPDYYKVTTDEAGYKQVVGPIEGLAKISSLFMKVVLVLGSAILILLSTLAIRERKYEIGVLRAMGMKKGKVALGILSEMVVITMVCLALGLGAGALSSQPIADSLLQNQIENAEDSSDLGEGLMVVGAEQLEPLSKLTVSLSVEAIGQITLIALMLAAVSSLVGIFYITRFEPRKILSERN